jgi:hypothetical protein
LDVAANGLEHHIARVDNFGEILRIVIDALMSTQAFNVPVVVGAGGRDYVCAKMASQLGGKSSDPSCATLDKDCLTLLKPGCVLRRPDCSEADERYYSRLDVAEPIWPDRNDFRADDKLYGV